MRKVEGKIEEELSEERTLLSNERTLLSYIRTSFAVIVAGIAILGFFREGTANVLGFIVLFIGVLFLVFGIIYYFIRKKNILKGELKL
jgi:putative membrane protein